jgi:hypothetical protein
MVGYTYGQQYQKAPGKPAGKSLTLFPGIEYLYAKAYPKQKRENGKELPTTKILCNKPNTPSTPFFILKFSWPAGKIPA